MFVFFLFQRYAAVRVACELGSCVILLSPGWCLAMMALVYLVFFIKLLCILVMCMRVFLSPECLCCAACSASLGPLVFHGSRREPLTTNVTFFLSVG